MTKSASSRKIIAIVIVCAALVVLITLVYGFISDGRADQKRKEAREEIILERMAYDDELPGEIERRLKLDGNSNVTVLNHDVSTHTTNGAMINHLIDVVNLEMYDFGDFDSNSIEYMYRVSRGLSDLVLEIADSVLEDYPMLVMKERELTEILGDYTSFKVEVSLEIYDGSHCYSYSNVTDVLYRDDVKIVEPVYRKDSETGNTSQKNDISQDVEEATDKAETTDKKYDSDFIANLMTDPDDYDDPDDYAEDAWGVDFDDYDEAYEFWENW